MSQRRQGAGDGQVVHRSTGTARRRTRCSIGSPNEPLLKAESDESGGSATTLSGVCEDADMRTLSARTPPRQLVALFRQPRRPGQGTLHAHVGDRPTRSASRGARFSGGSSPPRIGEIERRMKLALGKGRQGQAATAGGGLPDGHPLVQAPPFGGSGGPAASVPGGPHPNERQHRFFIGSERGDLRSPVTMRPGDGSA